MAWWLRTRRNRAQRVKVSTRNDSRGWASRTWRLNRTTRPTNDYSAHARLPRRLRRPCQHRRKYALSTFSGDRPYGPELHTHLGCNPMHLAWLPNAACASSDVLRMWTCFPSAHAAPLRKSSARGFCFSDRLLRSVSNDATRSVIPARKACTPRSLWSRSRPRWLKQAPPSSGLRSSHASTLAPRNVSGPGVSQCQLATAIAHAKQLRQAPSSGWRPYAHVRQTRATLRA